MLVSWSVFVIFVVMPAAIGYWYIQTGAEAVKLPAESWLWAIGSPIVTFLLISIGNKFIMDDF
jgi:hypothetical protein